MHASAQSPLSAVARYRSIIRSGDVSPAALADGCRWFTNSSHSPAWCQSRQPQRLQAAQVARRRQRVHGCTLRRRTSTANVSPAPPAAATRLVAAAREASPSGTGCPATDTSSSPACSTPSFTLPVGTLVIHAVGRRLLPSSKTAAWTLLLWLLLLLLLEGPSSNALMRPAASLRTMSASVSHPAVRWVAKQKPHTCGANRSNTVDSAGRARTTTVPLGTRAVANKP